MQPLPHHLLGLPELSPDGPVLELHADDLLKSNSEGLLHLVEG